METELRRDKIVVKVPASRPCGSCPYRRDVPSGVWAVEEYDKLEAFDRPTMEQPTSVFLCHQMDGRVCGGWAGCHDMDESLGVRIAALTGELDDVGVAAVLEYETDVALWDSGAQAAAHGRADVDAPGEAAGAVIAKLVRRQSSRDTNRAG